MDAIPYALAACAVLAMMFLLSRITLYSDDYYYSTFFYGGLSSFWEKTVGHYHTFNGRALIHFVAQVFLIFRTHLYAVLFPFIMAAVFALAHRLLQGDGARFSPAAVAVSLGIVLALPVEYLNQTLCWIAGSFNYCFPALLIVGYLLAQRRASLGGGIAAACVLAFLAGATTEQNGLAAIVGGGVIALCAIVFAERGKRPWKACVPVPFAVLGYLTVLLAPGTSNRIALEGGGTLSLLLDPVRLLAHFKDIMRYFTGADAEMPSAAVLLVILMLLLGVLPLFERKKVLRPLLLGFPAAVFYVIALYTKHATAAPLCVCLFLVIAAVCMLFDAQWRMSGTLILSGLASLGIMVFTNLGAYRTVMPTLLFLIAVSVHLGEVYLSRVGCGAVRAAAAVSLAVCAVISLPTFAGYRENYAVVKRNEEAIQAGKQSGEIVLCSDYVDLYRHTLMFEDGYMFTQFRASYRIPEETVVHIEGEHFAHYPIFVENTEIPRHAIMTQGVLYLPMVQIFEAFGGSCAWDWDTYSGYHLTAHGETYYLSKRDWCIRRMDTGEIVREEAYTYSLTDKDYIEIGAFASFMGVQYEFDGETVRFSAAKNLNETD